MQRRFLPEALLTPLLRVGRRFATRRDDRVPEGPNAVFSADKPQKAQLRPKLEETSAEGKMATARIQYLMKKNEFKEALAFFESLPEPSHVHFDAALNVCKQALWLDKALSIWSRMPDEARSVVSYTTLIGICAKLKRSRHAESLLDEMKRNGVKPNIITYVAVLHAYATAGESENAIFLLQNIPQEMLAEAPEDSRQTLFLRCMTACSWSGDYAGAHGVFVKMSEAGTRPNHAHFNALIVACSRRPDEQTAQGVFDTMRLWHLEPRVEDYTALLGCYRNNLPRCQQIFAEMKALGLRLGSMPYEMLLQAHVLAEDGPGARAIFNEASCGTGIDSASPRAQKLVAEMHALPA